MIVVMTGINVIIIINKNGGVLVFFFPSKKCKCRSDNNQVSDGSTDIHFKRVTVSN